MKRRVTAKSGIVCRYRRRLSAIDFLCSAAFSERNRFRAEPDRVGRFRHRERDIGDTFGTLRDVLNGTFRLRHWRRGIHLASDGRLRMQRVRLELEPDEYSGLVR